MTRDRLVMTCIPPLVAILHNLEKQKGAPLTEQEVLEIRDRSTAVALPRQVADALTENRGIQRHKSGRLLGGMADNPHRFDRPRPGALTRFGQS